MKTILFDLDGTLIDSTDAIVEGFEVAYDSLGQIPPNKTDIIKHVGYPLEIMFERLGMRGNVADYVRAYKEHYRTISKAKTTLLPFAKEAIDTASQYAQLGIVTTKTSRFSQELLEHLGILNYFKVLIGRENVTHPKPDPEPIYKAMEQLKAKKQKTWMIGDTILDIDAANKAGIKSVGVVCGYGSRQELLRYTKNIRADAYEAVYFIRDNT
ncbi:MAG: HAD family hydrolase [Sulfurospirillum sp.]|nr:HAD family hydrolase [Sulfurospirillum sp.]